MAISDAEQALEVQVTGNGHRERLSWCKSSHIMGRKVH